MPNAHNSIQIKAHKFLTYSSTAALSIETLLFIAYLMLDIENTVINCLALLLGIFCLAIYLHFIPYYHEAHMQNKRGSIWKKLYGKLEAELLISVSIAYLYNFDHNSYDLGRHLLLALIPFSAAAAIVVIRGKRIRKAIRLLAIPIIASLFLSIALVSAINCLPSPIAAEYHTAVIVDKETSGSKNRHYNLNIEYDGENKRLSTSFKHYSSVSIGDTVDISVNTGILGIQYIEIEDRTEGYRHENIPF